MSPPGLEIVKRLQLRAGALCDEFARDSRFEKRDGRRGKVLAAYALIAPREVLKSWAALEAMRLVMYAALTMGYSRYATSSSEKCSNQQSSILQRPISSASWANIPREMIVGKAGERASDARECRARSRTPRNLQACGAARSE